MGWDWSEKLTILCRSATAAASGFIWCSLSLNEFGEGLCYDTIETDKQFIDRLCYIKVDYVHCTTILGGSQLELGLSVTLLSLF